MASGFITFRGVNAGPCRGFYRTQALANAAATDNSGIVAHVGAVELGDLSPNVAYFNGISLEEERPLSSLSVRTRLRHAYREHHSHLTELAHAVIEEGIAHAITEQHIIHNMIAFAHHGAYTVAHDDDLTDDQKIAWAQVQILGPADITGTSLAVRAFHWYEAVRAIASPVAPTSACAWVEPSTGARINVAEINSKITEIFGDDPIVVTESDLAQGGWIDSLT